MLTNGPRGKTSRGPFFNTCLCSASRRATFGRGSIGPTQAPPAAGLSAAQPRRWPLPIRLIILGAIAGLAAHHTHRLLGRPLVACAERLREAGGERAHERPFRGVQM